MSGRPKQVDLGPIALPVGVDIDRNWTTPSARAGDVIHFHALLDPHRHRAGSDDAAPVETLPAEELNAPDADGLGREIGQLLVGLGHASAREVRIRLRPELLPDTTVRIFEGQGQLRVELIVGPATLGAWLASRLPMLVRDIGQRLGRAVGIWVLAPAGEVLGSDFWPVEGH